MSNTEITREKYLTEEEQNVILDNSYSKIKFGRTRYSFNHHTTYGMVLFMLKTGVRASELCSLSMNQIQKGIKNGEFQLVGKGALNNTSDKKKINKYTRTVYLNTELKDTMNIYLQNRKEIDTDEKNVFVNRYGKSLNKFSLLKRFKNLQRLSGIESPKKTHSCRHSFGMNVYGKTKDIVVTSELMGHSSTVVTQCYVRATEGTKRKAIEMI